MAEVASLLRWCYRFSCRGRYTCCCG
uniref:Uncharacterized protein n=1 Tax=Arundo donax TaxID=35708 RepID=A0A0A9AAZ1_ARUDO